MNDEIERNVTKAKNSATDALMWLKRFVKRYAHFKFIFNSELSMNIYVNVKQKYKFDIQIS